MPIPLCTFDNDDEARKGGGFQLGWESQRHSPFPALDRSSYGVLRLATATNKANGPGLKGFQGHSRCLEHLSASSHVGHREEPAIEPLATVS